MNVGGIHSFVFGGLGSVMSSYGSRTEEIGALYVRLSYVVKDVSRIGRTDMLVLLGVQMAATDR